MNLSNICRLVSGSSGPSGKGEMDANIKVQEKASSLGESLFILETIAASHEI